MSKIIDAIKRGAEYIAEDRSGYARVGQTEKYLTNDGEVEGGDYYITYGQDMMPPHSREPIQESQIESKMRSFMNDLRKWRYNGG